MNEQIEEEDLDCEQIEEELECEPIGDFLCDNEGLVAYPSPFLLKHKNYFAIVLASNFPNYV